MVLFNSLWRGVGIKEFMSSGIIPKGNVIARLEFDLAYKNVAVQHVKYYTTRTPYYSGGVNKRFHLEIDTRENTK